MSDLNDLKFLSANGPAGPNELGGLEQKVGPDGPGGQDSNSDQKPTTIDRAGLRFVNFMSGFKEAVTLKARQKQQEHAKKSRSSRRNLKLNAWVFENAKDGITAGQLQVRLDQKTDMELLDLIGQSHAPALTTIKRIITDKKKRSI